MVSSKEGEALGELLMEGAPLCFEGRQQLPGRQRSLDGQRSIHELGLIRHVRRSALIEP